MACLGLTLWQAHAARPFTVADSIAMTHLVDPTSGRTLWRSEEFKVSPDGNWLVVTTKRGLLAKGMNEYTLYSLRVDDVLRYLNSQSGALPEMRARARFEISSHDDAIAKLRWLPDSRHVAFIGRTVAGVGQVYLYDVDRANLERITNAPSGVVEFAIDRVDGRLLYGAPAAPDWSNRKRGFVVQATHVEDVMHADAARGMKRLKYFSVDLGTRRVAEIDTQGEEFLAGDVRQIALSPSGNFAIVNNPNVNAWPATWGKYHHVRMELPDLDRITVRAHASGAQGEARHELIDFHHRLLLFQRPMMIDLRSARARRMFEAPNPDPIVQQWSADSRRVLMAPILLPLSGVDGAERLRRRELMAVVEVDIDTGETTRIVDIPKGGQIEEAEWTGDGGVRVRFAARKGQGSSTDAYYYKLGGEWRRAEPADPSPASGPRVQFSIVQDVNTPFEIAARDLRTGRFRTITDLNPQLRELHLRKFESFTWRDSQAREYEAGLLLPEAYQKGLRYPVVLQTYGYDKSVFQVDGPRDLTAGMAARALASTGLIVVQLPLRASKAAPGDHEACGGFEPCGELPLFVTMVESAIDALVEAGLIERARVGLIGWSRTGMQVFHAITFGKADIAAASVIDSISYSPFYLATEYGDPYNPFDSHERMLGAPYWGEGIEVWQQRSAALNLHRIRAPLRIESFMEGMPAYWDSFVSLKRQRRPVEMVRIPLDTHNLNTPLGRFTSQQGNVDWFRFWLLGEQRTRPVPEAGETEASLLDQYSRWQRLKEQHRLLGE